MMAFLAMLESWLCRRTGELAAPAEGFASRVPSSNGIQWQSSCTEYVVRKGDGGYKYMSLAAIPPRDGSAGERPEAGAKKVIE